MAYGVATIVRSPRAESDSRRRRYVSCGDAPTNAPPMKCTTPTAARPFGGGRTHAPSSSFHPRAEDGPLDSDAAVSRASSAANASVGELDEEVEDVAAATTPSARRRGSDPRTTTTRSSRRFAEEAETRGDALEARTRPTDADADGGREDDAAGDVAADASAGMTTGTRVGVRPRARRVREARDGAIVARRCRKLRSLEVRGAENAGRRRRVTSHGLLRASPAGTAHSELHTRGSGQFQATDGRSRQGERNDVTNTRYSS